MVEFGSAHSGPGPQSGRGGAAGFGEEDALAERVGEPSVDPDAVREAARGVDAVELVRRVEPGRMGIHVELLAGRGEGQGGDEIHQFGKLRRFLARPPKARVVEVVIGFEAVSARRSGEIDHARPRPVGRAPVEQERAGVELEVAGALDSPFQTIPQLKVQRLQAGDVDMGIEVDIAWMIWTPDRGRNRRAPALLFYKIFAHLNPG